MNAAGKLAAFAVVLGGALGGGAALGAIAGPIDVDDSSEHDAHEPTSRATGGGTEREIAMNEDLPGGVLVSQSGYTLEPERTTIDGTGAVPFRFRITGPRGTAVEDYDVGHQRELHLIVVGRDLRTYAHLHPTRGSDGTWSTELPTLAPGAYRAFADFTVAGGPELTLGVDLTVPGASQPALLPDATTTTAVEGYEVDLSGTPVTGAASELELTVRKDGAPVTDLEPYLGSAGHLVAIRAGDLAYLHVHPLDDADGSGPGVRFAVEVPSPGDYRLFFDFSHQGVVRTAAFTVHVPSTDGAPASTPTTGAHSGH